MHCNSYVNQTDIKIIIERAVAKRKIEILNGNLKILNPKEVEKEEKRNKNTG